MVNFLAWMFVNLMVALGLVFLATYPPLAGKPPGPRERYWRDVAAAAVMAAFCMFYPWEPAPRQIIDLRMVPLGLVGLGHGWPAASVVGVVIIVVRSVIGGPGVIPTVFYTLGCVLLVPFFQSRRRTLMTAMAYGLTQGVVGYFIGETVNYLLRNPTPPGLEWYNPLWLAIIGVQTLGFVLVNGAIEHVQERQRLQESLAAVLRSKEALLETIAHGIVIIDRKRRVTDSNQAARTLLEGEALPAHILEHPEIERALSQQQRVSGCRVTFPGRRGQERILQVSVFPLQGGGAVLGLENVTNVVQEERAEAQRARLELMGRMAAMAAHEIRNPLTTIKGFLQLLGGRPEFTAHRGTLTLVQSEVEHINRVVGNFLELGAQPAEHELVPVDAVLEEVVAGMRLQFPDTAVTVSLEGEDGLLALADRKSLKQIVRNLVANAYEAMPTGGRLVLRRTRQDSRIGLAVSDTGPGMATEVLDHLFTPYTTTKATGTGLGLAISHKLAVDMGATLSVDSQLGQGCTFYLHLPQAAPAAAEAAVTKLD